MIVTNASDFINALQEVANCDVLIDIQGKLSLPTGVPIIKGQSNKVTIRGGTLDFAGCLTDGWPVRVSQLSMIGVTVCDYEGYSQAIDLQDVGLAHFFGCTFTRIGRVVHPPVRVPVTAASDTLYCQAIGGWSGKAEVYIVNCTFDGVGGQQVRWTHPIYLSEKNVTIAGCHFIRCGGGVNAYSLDRPVLFAGNLWEDAVLGNESYTSWEYPDFWWCDSGPATVVGNKIKGPVRWVFSGNVSNIVQRNNDWSEAKPTKGIIWPTELEHPFSVV